MVLMEATPAPNDIEDDIEDDEMDLHRGVRGCNKCSEPGCKSGSRFCKKL